MSESEATFENISTGEAIVTEGSTASEYAQANKVPERERVDGRVYDHVPQEVESSPAEINSVIDIYSDRDLRVAVIDGDNAEFQSLDRGLLEEMADEAASTAHLLWMVRTNLQESATAQGKTISVNLNGIDTEKFIPGGKTLEWRGGV